MARTKRKARTARSVYDVHGIRKAIGRVAGEKGCTITEEYGCTQPRTNMQTMEVIVEPLNPYWSKEKLEVWLGTVYHEIGHHAPEVIDIKDMMEEKQISWSSLVGQVINCVEDVRNELNQHNVYQGRSSALGKVQAKYCDLGAKALAKHNGSTDSADTKLIRDVLGWIYEYRSDYQPPLTLPAIEFNKYTDSSKYSRLSPMLDSMVTAEDVYNIVIEILEISPDHDAEEEQSKAQQQYKEGESEGGSKAGEGEADGKSEGSDKGEEGDERSKVAANGKVSYKDLMGHDHAASEGYTPGDSFLEIDYDHENKDDYEPNTEVNIRKARDLREGKEYRVRIESAYQDGSKLAAVVRRTMQSVIQKKKAHNKLSGRLDKRDLYRIPSGSVDVFTRKANTIDPKGVALHLLIDCSGSMGGNKYSTASAAITLLNDAVSPVGIPCKITGFGELGATELFIFKEYDERRTTEQMVQDCDNIGSHYLGNNPDGEAIMYAYQSLISRPEKRKVMIVLSDGQPASTNIGDCWSYTKSVIELAEKNMECYGIGIRNNAVEDLYKESCVIKKTSELEEALFNVVKRKVFNI